MKSVAKDVLTRIGTRTPMWFLRSIDSVHRYLAIGRWMSDRGYRVPVRVATRQRVQDLAIREVADRRVLYLEFGVWKGDSMRYWSRRLQHSEAMLHGFDSFQGLPETYTDEARVGAYDGGAPPVIDDPRVRFFAGWFEETVPSYVAPDHESLVVNLDADLYSSTILVLRHIRPILIPGALVYFDEFNVAAQELRAFEDFTAEANVRWEVVGADRSLTQVLFRVVA